MSSRSLKDWENIAKSLNEGDGEEAEEEMDTLEALQEKMAKVPRGMFVSGWDDPDELIEEDKDPKGKVSVILSYASEIHRDFGIFCLLTASLERHALWAAGENKLDVVAAIVSRKPAVVHAIDRDGYTVLHKASYNANLPMVRLALQYGADIHARTNMGWTALHSACKWNNAGPVALLLQFGADVNAGSDGDQTPLHIAVTVSSCRETLVTLLMNEACDPERRNNSNERAEEIAKRSGPSFPLFAMAHSAYRVETGMID
ncbi:ankyrin repeat domain-containing protein 49 [Anopheles darlingi]|uniref:Ankyrin repeat domain-containing protein 49 n=1 Tax=Anopheles darlingi TaxID=43151 RepID=W5JVH2_ANODA|nr:ankyrin repeat domain-containing protein 49 [Anopheles darlingi]